MAWPSGTKAGTTNVDQGTDKISLARPDIKQNIDNVNSIIDHYSDSGGPYSSVATYTKQQAFGLQQLTASSGNVAWDLNTAQVAEFDNNTNFTGNITCSNEIAGATYILIIRNNGSITTNTYTLNHASASFKYPGSISFYDQITTNSRCIVTLMFDGTDFLVNYVTDIR